MDDKHERRLKKIKISIMRNPRFAFWGGIMMVGRTSVDDDVHTARTNGRDEQYGRKFMDTLDDKELAFVVLHENMHKAYRHLTTWSKLNEINRHVANMACDYVINLQLRDLDPKESFIAVPMRDNKPLALIDECFRGMNAKQVFDILMQEQEGGGDGEGEGEGGGGGGIDDHDWDGAKELSEEQKKELEKEIDQALRSGAINAKKAGEGGGGMSREIDELLTPQVDWRDQLREFVRATCANKDTSSWRRPNRRFLTSGVYMPSMIGEKVGHIVIARDTSGSMGQNELSLAATEAKGIAEEVTPERIDFIDWDGVVESHTQYEGNAVANVDVMNARGGGGTDPRCVAAYLKEHGIKPECVIVLTDGYIDNWGSDDEWQGVPILWAVVGGNTAVSPVGKTIHVRN